MNTQLTTLTGGLAALRDQFADLVAIMKLHAQPGQDVETLVLQEIQYVQERAMIAPGISECSPMSVAMAVRKAIKNNVTLDPSAGLMYLIPGSVKNAQGQYVKVLEAPLTANGALSVAYQCGTILDHERPKVTYNDKGQCVLVTVRILRPTYGGTRWEEIEYGPSYFAKWYAASHKKNARGKNDAGTTSYANALYTSHNGAIDPEFAIAKSLRHALGKLGTNPNAKRMAVVSIPMEKTVQVEPEEEYTEHEVVGEYAATMIVTPADDAKTFEI